MLIMKKILSVVGIIGGTFFLLVAAICVEEWFSNPAYAADMEISGLIMCIVLGIFGVILIVLGIQTLRLQKLYREYKEIAEASNDGFIPDMAAWIVFPFTISVAILLVATAAPHPNVLNFTSRMI